MKTETDLNKMKKDALYAYLELCNIGDLVPDKALYDKLINFNDVEGLELNISIMESGIIKIKKTKTKIEMEIKRKNEESLFRQILNFFK
ncbi:hypothetical protein A0O34_15145 [Chryseobacterium glaciei]|uniref:Uncharacterized protein n=1 Tax=Chryseobacterium glaciei TaxID=1685010 RepID=A0A172XXM0_9FLAO|nr:hypothetical protein [Chryseobacterium glaciei]ANF51759.1 hypothetical protein A0O34_15145 [Chryseobacterium glaciei]